LKFYEINVDLFANNCGKSKLVTSLHLLVSFGLSIAFHCVSDMESTAADTAPWLSREDTLEFRRTECTA